jgi:O-antigen/teichoic acid export membrane protein
MASLRILKFIGAYTFLGFVPLAVSFFLLPLYASHLVPAEYGILTVANVTQTFATLILVMGLDSAVGRFYFDCETDQQRDRLLGTVLFTVFGLSIAAAGLLSFGGDWLFSRFWQGLPFATYGWYVLIASVTQILYAIIFTWYRNAENLRMAMAVALCTTACSFAGSVISIVFIRSDALGALVGKSLGFTLGVLPFVVIVLRRVPFGIDFALLRRLLSFGLPLAAYAIPLYVLFNGDRVLMQRWFSLSDLGLYSLAATLISPIEIVLQSGQNAIQPVFYRMLQNKQAGVAEKLGDFYLAVVLFNVVAVVGLVLLAEPVLLLFRGSRYASSSYYVAMLAFAQIFRVQYNAFAFSVFFSKKTGLLLVAAGAAIVGGGITAWIACRWLGPLGIAVGVAGWKLVHALATQRAMRIAGTVQVSVSRTISWTLACGAYVVFLYLVRSLRPDLYGSFSVVAGAILAASAGLAGIRHARQLGLFLRPTPNPPPNAITPGTP